MKWLDIPPLWLALLIAVAWAQARFLPTGVSVAGRGAGLIAALLIGAGLVLMAMAVLEFGRHRTTVVPHLTPRALITTGIFSRTRNPIYLGDTLVLAGAVLWLDAPLGLALVPVFVLIIQKRFILPEEDRMRAVFGGQFEGYAKNVRRWV
ncbi:MAG: isoprenylcysteine carboxylmethyltransferase family protein [Pseudomonadota bacterium]